MRPAVIATLAIALGSNLAGCDDNARTDKTAVLPSASIEVKAPVVAEPELPTDAPKVELLSAGADPKQELRYSFKEGRSQEWVMDQLVNVAIKDAKQRGNMPGVKMTVRIDTDKVEPNGVGHLRLSYSKAEVGESTLPAAVLEEMSKTFAQITRVKGTQVITNRGFILRSTFDATGVESEQLKAIIDSMQQSMKQLSNPLPKEPVGVGAKWKVDYDVELMGMALKQSANYEVVAMDGRKLELKVTLSQEAKDTKMALPGMPGAAQVEVKEIDSKGSGTSTLHLDNLLPTSNLSVETKLVTREAKGKEVSMNVTTTVSIALAD